MNTNVVKGWEKKKKKKLNMFFAIYKKNSDLVRQETIRLSAFVPVDAICSVISTFCSLGTLKQHTPLDNSFTLSHRFPTAILLQPPWKS